MESPAPAIERIVLYDGVCGFCNGSVAWLIDRDRRERLHFAALQGDTAAELRGRHPEIPSELDSIVYVERRGGQERVWAGSDALLQVLRELPAPWCWLGVLRVLPRRMRDALYAAFARRRYRWFGKLDACPVPPAHVRARFLA